MEDKVEMGIYSRAEADSMTRVIDDASESTPDTMVNQITRFH